MKFHKVTTHIVYDYFSMTVISLELFSGIHTGVDFLSGFEFGFEDLVGGGCFFRFGFFIELLNFGFLVFYRFEIF